MTALEVKGLSKRYGSFAALEDVSLQLEEGKCLYVYGKNGAGKTTFLEIVAGISKQTNGTVKMYGKELNQDSLETMSGVSGIFEDSFLYGDLTLKENLLFFGKLYEIENVLERINALLVKFKLTDKENSLVKHLSCGQERIAAIIRAVLTNPKLLILDEPLKGLDGEARRETLNYLKEINSYGTTLVFSSHDITVAQEIATDMLHIENGKFKFFKGYGEGEELISANKN